MKPEYRLHAKLAGMMLLLVVLHILTANLVTIASVQPSFLLIGIAFIAVRHGQLPAMLHAFPAGLLLDLYLGDVVGISSLSLVIAGFVAGYFHHEERAATVIRSPRMVWALLAAAFAFHAIFVFTYVQTLEIDILGTVLKHVFGATLYTTVVGTIPLLLIARTGGGLKV